MMVISRRGGLNDWKVVGNITNQLKLQPPNIAAEKVSGEEVVATATVAEVLPVPKKTKVLVKGRGKKRGRYKTKLEPEPVPRSCKFCEANFPEEYLCLEHEDRCQKIAPPGHDDLRDAPERLHSFASYLGLVPTASIVSTPQEVDEPPVQFISNANVTAGCDVEVIQPKPLVFKRPLTPPPRSLRRPAAQPLPTRLLRKVPVRSKIRTFLNRHPRLPITSERGQMILKEFGELDSNTIPKTPEYEKDCRSRVVVAPRFVPKISTPKRKKIVDNQYVHQYSFTSKQKLERNTELVLGLKSKSFKAYNACKPIQLKSHKVPSEIVHQIQTRDAVRRQEFLARCEVIKLSPFPFLRVRDALKDPGALTKDERKNLKVNFKTVPKGIRMDDVLNMLTGRKLQIRLKDIMKDAEGISEDDKRNLKINLNIPTA